MVDEAAALRRFREEHAGVFATLWRRMGEFDLVDVSLADAYLAAIAAWPDGIPANPATWMATVAMSATTGVVSRRPEAEPATPEDDLRGLLWACAHPGLTDEQRLLLTVRAVAGLMPAELAALLRVPEAEIKKRLDGAKTGLRKLGGRAPVAADGEAERTALVLATIAAIKAAPGAEAAAVGALLDERVARAFGAGAPATPAP